VPLVCQRCGQENPDGFRFCGACGAPLAAPARAREQRKVLTILFCDVAGSTTLGERLDPEALRHVMRRYFDEMTAIVDRHGGTVEKFIGDAVMAVFGVPHVREDDALRAVRAAAEIRERLPAVAQELGVALTFRTGINTGEVVVGAGQTLATGDAMNVAARLEQAAPPGEILIGADTRLLVRDAVQVEPVEPLVLKGKAHPVAAWRLIAVDPSAEALARHLDTPLVGRERELSHLRGAYDRAVLERSCHLFTLLGSAGAGKSRLVAELLAGAAGEATVVRGRCLHYGDGVTFWPVIEILTQLGEPAAEVRERVAQGGAGSPEELFWDVRRLLERVAEERPLVVVFEDLQWAEPMLLDLLDHVADLSRGAPILLLCVARPELLDERAAWGGGKLNATTLLLEPLAPADCETMLDGVGADLDPQTRARILYACGGNPLFLEEMVALVHDGGGAEVPPTIRALLDARLERLGEDERSVIERGAVEGEVFHHGAVQALAPETLRAGIDGRLAALVRKEMIRPERGTLPGEEAFRFRHLLVRDAAYDALPKQARAELHERFAGWLEHDATALVELDEIAGWHLEQAVRYRRELGLALDPALASRAADHLAAAGRRAADRHDLRAADSMLTRALALVERGDDRRPRLALDLARAIVPSGQMDRVGPLLDEAEDDPGTRPGARITRSEQLMMVEPEEGVRIAEEELPGVIEQLEAAGDHSELARAHMAVFMAFWMRSLAVPSTAAGRRSAEHARLADDRAQLASALAWIQAPLMFGPEGTDAMERWIAEAASLDLGPFVQIGIEQAYAHLALMAGDFAEARRRLLAADALYAAVGMELLRSAMGQFAAQLELSAGDAAAAVRAARESYDLGTLIGDHSYHPTTGAWLARALAAAGDHAEAERVALAVEEESASVDIVNFVMSREVLARVRLAAGALEEAERLARESLAFALQSDFPILQGESLLVLGEVLRAREDEEAATAAFERALALFESKGNRPAAARARDLLAAAQPAAD
jgi:class 3 adenylate cyclase